MIADATYYNKDSKAKIFFKQLNNYHYNGR